WIKLIRRVNPDVVSSGTPKAGLLGMLASWILSVPVRVYMLRGLRLATESGFSRCVLGYMEKLASWCSTSILSVSRSLKEEFIELGMAPKGKVNVLGHGSSNGVVVPDDIVDRNGVGHFTVGFVGRIHPDKGVDVLLEAMM